MNTLTTSLRTRKGELFETVQPMSRKVFRGIINPIIANKRNISLKDACSKKDVRHIEVKEFLSEIGEDVNNYILRQQNNSAA